MKRIAFILFVVSMFSLNKETEAQRRNNYGSPAQKPKTNNYGNPDTTIKGDVSNYGNNNNASTGVDSSLPITVIKSSGNGLFDSTKMSLRPDGAVVENHVSERIPLAYEDLREDDAVFKVRVWREIDAREKMNLAFRYAAVEDNGSQLLLLPFCLRPLKTAMSLHSAVMMIVLQHPLQPMMQ